MATDLGEINEFSVGSTVIRLGETQFLREREDMECMCLTTGRQESNFVAEVMGWV